MNLVIYDIEIKKAIPTIERDREPGIEYCSGWYDHAGMGIAVIAAYDILHAQPRIFLDDNLAAFASLIAERDGILGYNNWRFDDRLLEANGIAVPEGKSHDLAALIWRTAGIPQGEHPRGLGLDAICKANGLPGKSGDGAMAPILYQTGRLGELTDYCLTDTLRTLRLYHYARQMGGVRDPRNSEFLTFRVPQ